MGASGWQYFVPYQEDITDALEALRKEVFERGDYYRLDYDLSQPPPGVDELREEFGQDAEGMAAMLSEDHEFRKRLLPLTTIDALMQWNAESGTHSILDISYVSRDPQFGTVSPLTRGQLMELFGTEHPTRAMVEAKAEKLFDYRDRWEGLYVIVYENDQPAQIFFSGFSGD